VEKYLKQETIRRMLALIDRSASRSADPGKQSRGKLGAEAHRYFDQVEAVRDLTEEQVNAQRAAYRCGLQRSLFDAGAGR
jgi:hypothetical protein